ncbi:MAG TPA: amidase [Planctomycetaceae bacterium]|jgi:aspartyl-tRNA(Asn)/glutamyl-tRNA(Gln) amidotransferase subunit A|nr:amidase [Planctomycetaceae bacterium]
MPLVPEHRTTIIDTAEALARGEITCEEVLDACLKRIEACDGQIHAWVGFGEEAALTALRKARECDAELARRRSQGITEPPSPLFGIPLGIKDIIDIAGQPTAAGSQARAMGPPATADATVVGKLRAARAIILGKTVTTQFACFDPPPTRNPWNLKHTPGGSSSGSAAGVAAGMCLGALGSQTGGSITRPASFCGVAGCKPTFARVSCDGFVPVAPSLDTPGPLAACVADLAILLNAILVGDSAQRTIDLAALKPGRTKPPRLALLGGFFDSLADSSMKIALNRAATRLRAAGASVVERDLPPAFDGIHRSHRTIMVYELAESHRERFSKLRFDYLPELAALIQEGLTITNVGYQADRLHQTRVIAESEPLMQDVDALICPAALGPAPDLSTTGDSRFNSPWTYTGQPTITFPIELSAEGLPLGIQLVGRRFDDAGLFRAAAWCESVLPGLMPNRAAKEPAG